MKTNANHIRYKHILLTLLASTSICIAASLSIQVSDSESSDTTPQAIISSDHCESLGALQMTLQYDPSVLRPTTVETGELVKNGLVEYEIATAGKLHIALISSNAIKQPGELLVVSFQKTGQSPASSELTLSNTQAWEFENNTEMLVSTRPGALRLVDHSGALPSSLIPKQYQIPGLIGASSLIVLLLIILILKKRPNKTGDGFCSECGTPHSEDAKFCPNCGNQLIS